MTAPETFTAASKQPLTKGRRIAVVERAVFAGLQNRESVVVSLVVCLRTQEHF